MKRAKRSAVALTAAALVAGALAMAAPASGGVEYEKPWPILKVMKTIGEAEQQTPGAQIEVPPDTVFTIEVTCDYPDNNGEASVSGDPFPTTLLTFDYQGAPKSADQGGWEDLGDGYWTYQGKELKYKQCTAVETDVTPQPETLDVAYKCDSSAEEVVREMVWEEEAETANGVEFGCVAPLPEGEYAPAPPAENASVQFTAFWDRSACGVEPGEDPEAESYTRIKCQETGVLTVDNLDPAWVVVAAIEVTPTFTG